MNVKILYEHFNIPLASAGVTVSSVYLLNQWHEFFQYFCNTFSECMKTWQRIFSSPWCCAWKEILTLVELLFIIPVGKAKVERMLSKLKHIKTGFRASLTTDRIESLLCIIEQCAELENYGITNAVRLWHNCKDRHPNQKPHRNYRQRVLSKKDFP